jgi:hypothetical protein
LGTKERVAFRSGLLGVDSFGWSTLAIVTELDKEEHGKVVETFAHRIHEVFNAPSIDAARAAALEELTFAISLCDHPPQTLLAVQRTFEHGEIRERFRTIAPKEDFSKGGFNVFTFEATNETELPVEKIDLVHLSKERAP